MSVPGVGSPPPSPPSGDPGVAGSNLQPTVDTIKEMTAQEWLGSVQSAAQLLKKTLYDTIQSLAGNRVDAFQALAASLGTDALATYNAVLSRLHWWRDVSSVQMNVFNETMAYNSTIQAETQLLNNAIQAYNNSPTPANQAAYEAAANRYNTVVGQLVTSYNNTVNSYNAFTSAINARDGNIFQPNELFFLFFTHGVTMPPLSPAPLATPSSVSTFIDPNQPPAQTVPSPPTLPLINIGTTLTLPNWPSSLPPTDFEGLGLYFRTALFISFYIAVGTFVGNPSLTDALNRIENSINERSIVLPPGAKEPKFISSYTGGMGATPTVTNLVVGSSTVYFQGISALGIAKAFFFQHMQLSTELLRKINKLIFQILQREGVNAAGGVSEEIDGNELDSKTIPDYFNIRSGTLLLQNILAGVNSEALGGALKALVDSEPDLQKLTPEQKKELTEILTATTAIGLTQAALLVAALSIGAPGLLPQLLSNVLNNIPELRDLAPELAQPTEGTRLAQVLSNPGSLAALAEELVNALLATATPQEDLTAAKAQTLATTAFLSILEGDVRNISSFKGSLIANLVANGLKEDRARLVAETLIPTLRNEVQLPELDRILRDPERLSAVVDALGQPRAPGGPAEIPPELAAAFPAGSGQRAALTQLLSSVISSTTINTLDKIAKEPFTTIRDFRDRLSEELQASGVPSSEILSVTNLVAQLLAPFDIEGDSLRSRRPTSHHHVENILEALNSHINTQLGPVLGNKVKNIQAEADQTMLDILKTLNEQIRLLKERAKTDALKKEVLNNFYEGLQLLSQPELSAFVLTSAFSHLMKSQLEAVVTQSETRTRQQFPGAPGTGRGWVDIPV